MAPEILTERALNRALLERQLLSRRADLAVAGGPIGPVIDAAVGATGVDAVIGAVEHLVGMQAQSPTAPYVGLWTRLDGFAIGHLVTALTERKLVRASLMRGTIHLVSARDRVAIHPFTQPLLARTVRGALTPADLAEVQRLATELLEERPCGLAELRRLLAERRAGDPEVMARAARMTLPLVHVPPRASGAAGPRPG